MAVTPSDSPKSNICEQSLNTLLLGGCSIRARSELLNFAELTAVSFRYFSNHFVYLETNYIIFFVDKLKFMLHWGMFGH